MANQYSQRVGLFNCDGTYKLDAVERFLVTVQEKHGLEFSIDKRYFGLNEMSKLCETILPQLEMDFAIFVVHAEESRLSINEDNAGIGYSKIYRALLQATEPFSDQEGVLFFKWQLTKDFNTLAIYWLRGSRSYRELRTDMQQHHVEVEDGRVLIVIGGDDNYRDREEEKSTVISRWAKRKVASQFHEEYLDGRKSFIFSWNKQHREIHEEALLHYFDPSKKGQKFEHQPKPKPVPLQANDDKPIITRSGETVKIDPATGNSRPIYGDGSSSNFVRDPWKEDHMNPSYGATNPAYYSGNTTRRIYNYDDGVQHQDLFHATACWRRNWLPIFVAVAVVILVIVVIIAATV